MFLKIKIDTNDLTDIGTLERILNALKPQSALTVPTDADDTHAPTPIDGLDVDLEGLPWDARIHSSSKTKNKDGSWKRMRGISDEAFYKVAQELRAILSINNDIDPPSHESEDEPKANSTYYADIMAAAKLQNAISKITDTQHIDTAEVFKQNVDEVTQDVQPDADVDMVKPITYLELVSILGTATKEGRIDNTKIQEAVTGVGLAAFPQLGVRIDLIPAFMTRLGI